MDSLTELKQNENLLINSNKLEEEFDVYFDNISKEDLIRDLNEAGIEVQDTEKNLVPVVDAYICNQNENYIFKTNKKSSSQSVEENEMELLAA
jgi:replicative DNA helicase